MANTILINSLVESGVNTQSRLLKVSVDAAGTFPVPHTLLHAPVWAQVIQAKEVITGLPANVRVYPQIQETPAAPNGTVLGYGSSASPPGLVYVYFTAPAGGQTEVIHFTLHLGRTHSRAR